MVEWIPQLLPALMNVAECLDFEHGPDATIASAAMARLEQPAINFPPFFATGGHDLVEGCLWMLI